MNLLTLEKFMFIFWGYRYPLPKSKWFSTMMCKSSLNKKTKCYWHIYHVADNKNMKVHGLLKRKKQNKKIKQKPKKTKQKIHNWHVHVLYTLKWINVYLQILIKKQRVAYKQCTKRADLYIFSCFWI